MVDYAYQFSCMSNFFLWVEASVMLPHSIIFAMALVATIFFWVNLGCVSRGKYPERFAIRLFCGREMDGLKPPS